jgi:hypothetical protein
MQKKFVGPATTARRGHSALPNHKRHVRLALTQRTARTGASPRYQVTAPRFAICDLLFAILKASMPSAAERPLRRPNYPRKTVRVQASSTDQRAVNVRLAHQLFCVLGFNTSTVLNPSPIGSGLVKQFAK